MLYFLLPPLEHLPLGVRDLLELLLLLFLPPLEHFPLGVLGGRGRLISSLRSPVLAAGRDLSLLEADLASLPGPVLRAAAAADRSRPSALRLLSTLS